MSLDPELPDRGPGAPVRPGGGSGMGVLIIVAVLIVGGALAYIFTQTDRGWYGSPIEERVDPVPARPVAPPVQAPRAGQRLQPAGSPQNWVTDDDYPAEALRKGWQGTVGFTLEIDAAGKPSACRVTAPSGTPMLDQTACALLMRRARFVPARDASGQPIGGSFTSRFTWRIPE